MSLAKGRGSQIVRSGFILMLALYAAGAIEFAVAQTPAFTPREEEPEDFPEARVRPSFRARAG